MHQLSCFMFLLVLFHSIKGQSQLICPPEPITALVGHDVILPCTLKPAVRSGLQSVEWTRSDLDPKYVHVQREGRWVLQDQNPSYVCRSALFVDQLMNGNVSLQLSRVQLSDEGEYRCNLPLIQVDAVITLNVGAASSPVLTIEDIDEPTGLVVLQCESSGWYPQPELWWLDARRHAISAGRPQTDKGPDQLYTISSRVTVDDKHGRTFTCRVQQNSTNQSRETHKHVPERFFSMECQLSATTISAVYGGFFLITAVVVCVWRCHLSTMSRDSESKHKFYLTVPEYREQQVTGGEDRPS